MIIAKPFNIAAGAFPDGGSTYNIVGSKFFLLAASEPLNVQLYRGASLVADLEGFQGGLRAGPYCEAFNSVRLTTQSGAAGNALIGVGDEDMDYNPMAGALNFTNPALSAVAQSQPTAISTALNQSLLQQNFTVRVALPNNAATYGSIKIDSNGVGALKKLAVNGINITNSGATAVSVILGFLNASGSIGAGPLTAINLFAGGAASVFTEVGANAVALFGQPPLNPLKVVQLAAGQQLDVDMSAAPFVLNKGATGMFVAQCQVANSPISYELRWSET